MSKRIIAIRDGALDFVEGGVVARIGPVGGVIDGIVVGDSPTDRGRASVVAVTGGSSTTSSEFRLVGEDLTSGKKSSTGVDSAESAGFAVSRESALSSGVGSAFWVANEGISSGVGSNAGGV